MIRNCLTRFILVILPLYLLINIFCTVAHPATESANKTPDKPSDTLSEIKKRGEIRIGVSIFVPWTMKDKKGNLIGYEIDMANRLAEDIGVKAKFVTVPFKEVIQGLRDDRFDIIMDGLYITPQRALVINFSEPEAKSSVTLLALKKFKDSNSVEDFNKPGIKIGAVAGTVYADLAESKFPNAELQKFDEEGDMLTALTAEKIDAVVAINQIVELTLKNNLEKLFMPLPVPIGKFGEGFAVRKGDPDFLNYMNTWIRYYRQNGWLEQRRDYWFNNSEWEDLLLEQQD